MKGPTAVGGTGLHFEITSASNRWLNGSIFDVTTSTDDDGTSNTIS